MPATAPEQDREEVGTARCAVPARVPAGGRNVVGGSSDVVRFRRLTLRSATGTAQRAVPTRGQHAAPF
jgi:hypothetical protein